jgi:hypothetical protein
VRGRDMYHDCGELGRAATNKEAVWQGWEHRPGRYLASPICRKRGCADSAADTGDVPIGHGVRLEAHAVVGDQATPGVRTLFSETANDRRQTGGSYG